MPNHTRPGLLFCLVVVLSWACQCSPGRDLAEVAPIIESSETPPSPTRTPPTETDIPSSPTPEEEVWPFLPAELAVIDPQSATNLRAIAELPVSRAGVLAFSLEGDQLAVGLFEGGLVQILDLGSGEILMTLRGHSDSRIVSYLSFSPAGDQLASASQGWDEENDSLILWDIRAQRANRTFEGALGAISPDWRTLVLSTRGDPSGARVQILDLESGDTLYELPARSDIYGFSFSPDGTWVAGRMPSPLQDLIAFWDVKEGREVRTLFDWQNFVFSPDGRFLAAVLDTGSRDTGELTVFDAVTWKYFRTVDKENDSFWYALPAFSPDGRLLAASFGTEVRLWDTDTWKLITQLPMPDVVGLVFSPDGRMLAAYARTHPVKLFGIPLDSSGLFLDDPRTG